MECDALSQIELIDVIKSYLGPTAAAVAEFVHQELRVEDNALLILASLAVHGNFGGNTCLDLSILGSSLSAKKKPAALKEPIILPPLEELLQRLHQASVLVECINVEGPTLAKGLSVFQPLVLVGRKLFTRRQYIDEFSIALNLTQRQQSSGEKMSAEKYALVDAILPVNQSEKLVDGVTKAVVDSIQNEAGRAILDRKLVVLTGGPGTGKTYTMIRLLALAVANFQGTLEHFAVAVCAPTGKAAARAGEELSKFVEQEKLKIDSEKQFSDDVLDKLASLRPTTIHRLMGRKKGVQTRFYHDSSNNLAHQLVAIDEASMVPSQLMARLLEACDASCQILLVGDEAQLESVESGSVLAEVVEAHESLKSSIHTLQVNHRAGPDSALTRFAHLIREGEAEKAISIIDDGRTNLKMMEPGLGSSDVDSILDGAVDLLNSARLLAEQEDETSHTEALRIAGSVKVLCGPRDLANGRGVLFWDQEIADRVLGKTANPLVAGRPLLITANSPATGLNNGDIGLVVKKDDELAVVFQQSEGGIRYFSSAELPSYTSCFAMTVHKSQGSEYTGYVIVVMPQKDSPLLVRELVYTAITRAKKDAVVRIVGTNAEFRKAVTERSERTSGLSTLIALCANENSLPSGQ